MKKIKTEVKVSPARERDRKGEQKYLYGLVHVKSKDLAEEIGKKVKVTIEKKKGEK